LWRCKGATARLFFCAGGRHVWLLCKLDESFAVAGGRDQTDAYLLLSNHYLAGFASSIMLTPIRVVCNNTITMALDGSGRRWTHSHLAEFDAEAAKAQLGIGKQGFRKYAEQAEFLTAKRMTGENFVTYIKRVYDLKDPQKDDAEARAANQRVIDRLKETLSTHPGADLAAGSWWQGFNAVTHDNDHVIGRSPSVRLASGWYGVGALRKQKALTLAVEYATAS
jgi:phage/plasmid-like protein (TIGR03299 family)